jgi:choline kinase
MSRFVRSITQVQTCNNKQDISIAILSAGIGARIKSYEPRSMIKIGSKTLIEHQINTLEQCFESPEIIAVVGYGADKITKRVRGSVRIVENQIYQETNTSESMRLAFNNTTKNNFLFIHGDLYFNQDTLSNLDYNKSFILIDDKNQFSDKEVGVTSNKNVATILSYGLPVKWAQIAYITGKEIEILKKIFHKFDSISKKNLSFEIINKMISMGACFQCYQPTKMSILEIDCIKDLKNENINFE